MKCPGQDTRNWRPEDIFDWPCPACGKPIEFFKDDTARRCGQCGHRFANPKMDFGCASYCPHAEQCLGTLPPEVAAQQESQEVEQQDRSRPSVEQRAERLPGSEATDLVTAGTFADSLYVFVEGNAVAERGVDTQSLLLGEGDVAGVSCMLSEVSYAEDVVACGRARVLC